MAFIEQVRTNPPASWESLFRDRDRELEHISKILEARDELIVPQSDLFLALRLTPLQEVKVVLLGSDPGGDYEASPLAYSSNGRLVSVFFQELKRSIPGFREPDSYDLTPWARQGVLLLNTCLTSDLGKAGAHRGLWHPFVIPLLELVVRTNPGAVFLLLGDKVGGVVRKQKTISEDAVKLEAPHPSTRSKEEPFLGCNIFAECNKLLRKQGKEPIQW